MEHVKQTNARVKGTRSFVSSSSEELNVEPVRGGKDVGNLQREEAEEEVPRAVTRSRGRRLKCWRRARADGGGGGACGERGLEGEESDARAGRKRVAGSRLATLNE
eukprot:766933-Hanusia_phi.AAC.9